MSDTMNSRETQVPLETEAQRRIRDEERQRWLGCAMVDATMEGPKLRGWNRSALDRLWRESIER